MSVALIAELAKKTSVCWLRYAGTEHPVWHLWHDDALIVLSGGTEQPLPEIEKQRTVDVLLRSKDNGGRLVTWTGRAATILPADPLWAPVTAALVAARLNLEDLAAAAGRWAEHSVVTRIVPGGPLVEAPGSLSSQAHLAVPRSTPATTRGPLPKVLHRRGRPGRRLS